MVDPRSKETGSLNVRRDTFRDLDNFIRYFVGTSTMKSRAGVTAENNICISWLRKKRKGAAGILTVHPQSKLEIDRIRIVQVSFTLLIATSESSE